MGNSMIIIGAGIAGLSTGCYAQMNGYHSTIFEMHTIPGGLCTAWKRNGYTFDISMHNFIGSRPGTYHQLWEELGVLENRRFHYPENMGRIESKGKRLDITADPKRLEEQMLALSPGDVSLTREFIRLLSGKSMYELGSLKPIELYSLMDRVRTGAAMIPLLNVMRKYGKKTIQQFARRFKDPFLQNAVRFFMDAPGWPMPRFPLVGLSGFLHAMRESSVPIGGSQQVAFRVAEQYRRLGGALRFRSRVRDVIVEDDRAKGIRLTDGTEHRADIVVWAGDGRTLIFDVLAGSYLNDRIRDMYQTWTPVLPLVHVSMGVNRDLSKEPPRTIFELEKPVQVAGEDHPWMFVLHHSFDPTMAPPGKSAVEVWYATRYKFWEALSHDRPVYDAEKRLIAEATVAALDRHWPGFAKQVEVLEVATPATYVRYTGNWKGSPDGWYITPENMKKTFLRTLPGLSNLYMVGQWTAPFTGAIFAAVSGRQLIELLCRRQKREFVTSPEQAEEERLAA